MSTSVQDAPRRRWPRSNRGVLWLVTVLAWVTYRVSVARPNNAQMPFNDSCASQSTSVAVADEFVDGASAVPCQAWDIGTGVSGYVWHASDPRGAILFQHGWGDYAQRWVQGADHMISRLVADGYTVYAFDMWGSGNTPGVRGMTSISDAVQDHLAARRAIDSGEDGQLPLIILGHSVGGQVTITSALEDQRDLAGVILLAPALKYEASRPLLSLASVGSWIAPSAPIPGMTNKDGVTALTRDPEVQQQMIDDQMLYMGKMNWLTAATGGWGASNNWDRYDQLTVPILAAHGTADDSTDPAGSQDLIDTVSSEDKQLELIDDARHSLLDDYDADELTTTMHIWLNEHLAR